MATWVHLARRFAGSLRPGGLPPDDEAWAVAALVPGERALWRRMCGADRRHAVGVARATGHLLGDATTRAVLAAALLHDVGKIDVRLGPFGRAAATVVARVVGYGTARRWRDRRGPLGRAGRYVCHDEIGAQLLAAASSDPLTVAWAREHHRPDERWTVPPAVGAALKAADDD